MSGKKIAAYLGGTFDPVHAGHIAMARAALESGRCNEVWFGCAWIQPQKRDRRVTGIIHRLNMTALALEGREGMRLCDYEARRRPEPSYTIDVLRGMNAEYPEWEFRMLIGGDSLLNLHTWHQADALVREQEFITVPRPGFPVDAAALEDRWHDPEIVKKLLSSVLPAPFHRDSSTEIRKNCQTDLVLPEIRAYIDRCGLYKERKRGNLENG